MFYSISNRIVNNMNIEIIIVGLAVLFSAFFIVRRILKTLNGKKTGCSCCGDSGKAGKCSAMKKN